MVFGKLHAPLVHPRSLKAKLAAEYTGVELELTPDFAFGTTNKTSDYLEKFPLGKAPSFEQEDFYLTESSAIAFYIANSKDDSTLLGNNKKELAKIWQYILYAETAVAQPIVNIIRPIVFNLPIDAADKQKNLEQIHGFLAQIEAHLSKSGQKYLVGERVSLADINLFANLIIPFARFLPLEEWSKYGLVKSWFDNLLSQPEFKKVLPQFSYFTQ